MGIAYMLIFFIVSEKAPHLCRNRCRKISAPAKFLYRQKDVHFIFANTLRCYYRIKSVLSVILMVHYLILAVALALI